MSNRNSLLERIQQIQSERGTGMLTLGQDKDLVAIYFQDGLINAVSTAMPEFQIGQILAKGGFIHEHSVIQLVEDAQRQKQLLGEAAVDRKLLDGAELVEAVQEQAIQILFHALKNDFEVRSFVAQHSSFYQPARIGVDHLALGLARRNLKPFKLEPNKLLVLSNGHGLSNLPWYPLELSVLSKLKFPRTLQELAVATGVEFSRLGKILSVLDALQMISYVEDPHCETTAVAKRERFPFEYLIPEVQKAALSDKLETFHDETSFVSEQFKTLKVRIGELAAARPIKVITVSSPHIAEGKTLVSANLAISYSKDLGRRTILIDCDLRKPSVHKYFGITQEPGLAGFLEKDLLQPYCYMRRLDQLYILTAGGEASNPVELLSREKMQQLIMYLKSEFDIVILDSPPMTPLSDSQILTSISDGLLVVMRSGKTTYSDIEKAYRTLDRGKLLGVVFNDVMPRMFHTQYDHRYYRYRYGSHYPYRSDRLPRPRVKSYLE